MTAILLLSCPDRTGLVSRISHFIYERSGNIIELDEHVDRDENIFFIRVSWDMENFSIPWTALEEAFQPLAKEFNATWKIKFTGEDMKVAIFVSREDHCLREILWRQQLGEFSISIPLIISNHQELKALADNSEGFHMQKKNGGR